MIAALVASYFAIAIFAFFMLAMRKVEFRNSVVFALAWGIIVTMVVLLLAGATIVMLMSNILLFFVERPMKALWTMAQDKSTPIPDKSKEDKNV